MLAERLQGLLLILVGCTLMLLLYLAQQSGWLQARPPIPAGVRPDLLPVVTPLSCLLPLASLGAVGLCLVGIRKLLTPDTWQPPKHLDAVSRETFNLPPRARPVRRGSPLRRLLRRLLS